jgi:hypothetical protein
MSCGQVKDWLGPYLDSEVSPDVQRAVEAHIAECAACSAELESLRRMASLLATPIRAPVSPELWHAIERRLNEPRPQRRVILSSFRSVFAAAAVLVIAVGVGLFSLQWGVQRAEAATVNFGVLLDALKFDPQRAFAEFLSRYEAQEVSLERAKRHGRDLNFAIPETLPGGFKLVSTYALRFGHRPGVAVRYDRDGELLGAIFHPPVLREDFGTHEDRECVVGKHRGHAVEVGEWSLVHVTDPTTCHCVLSRLDMESGLPAIMAAVAPAASETQPTAQPVPERP